MNNFAILTSVPEGYEILEKVPSVGTFAFIIGIILIFAFLFYFRVFYLFTSVISGIFVTLKDIVVRVYTHFMILGYQRKADIDMSEYRKGAVCEFRGIKCKHITNADVLIIEHLPIFKPIVIFCYFCSRVANKFRRKRDERE